jgi:RimJ/RimL family protein N-acetyltransferase
MVLAESDLCELPMQLTLTKSTIRSYRAADAPALARQIGSASVARNMCLVPHPYFLNHATEWIASATSKTPETNFAITIDDEVVGGIGLTLLDPERAGVSRHAAELGYWLGEPFWGRGIMTEAVQAFTDWGFAELGLMRIFAAVYARNPASARVLEKAGFAFEGREIARYCKDGEFLDGLRYAKVRLPV